MKKYYLAKRHVGYNLYLDENEVKSVLEGDTTNLKSIHEMAYCGCGICQKDDGVCEFRATHGPNLLFSGVGV